MSASCGSCSQPVWWTRTQAGHLMPVDPPPPVATGTENVAVLRAANGDLHSRVLAAGETPRENEKVTTSHFASCPGADKHRKPRGRR